MEASPTAGIGDRVRKYRLMSGMSAQKLSDRLGGAISRGVIANIESGAKKDVTVDELVMLAWGIDVPPALLAFPADDPTKLVPIAATDTGGTSFLRSIDAVRLFNGEQISRAPERRGAARTYGMALLRGLERARRASETLSALYFRDRGLDVVDPSVLAAARTEYDEAYDELESLGVDRVRATFD